MSLQTKTELATQTKPSQPPKLPKLNARQLAVINKIVKQRKPAGVAYAEVYDVSNSASADANASRLLSNDRVQNALQIALKKQGIDEDSIATELVNIKNNWDWRAKEAYVKHSAKFLGYGGEEQAPQVQVAGVINNWKETK